MPLLGPYATESEALAACGGGCEGVSLPDTLTLTFSGMTGPCAGSHPTTITVPKISSGDTTVWTPPCVTIGSGCTRSYSVTYTCEGGYWFVGDAEASGSTDPIAVSVSGYDLNGWAGDCLAGTGGFCCSGTTGTVTVTE